MGNVSGFLEGILMNRVLIMSEILGVEVESISDTLSPSVPFINDGFSYNLLGDENHVHHVVNPDSFYDLVSEYMIKNKVDIHLVNAHSILIYKEYAGVLNPETCDLEVYFETRDKKIDALFKASEFVIQIGKENE